MTCCAYSCTQYCLQTVNIPNIADDLLCLQLHTVWSPYTVNIPNLADDLLCLQLHTVWSPDSKYP